MNETDKLVVEIISGAARYPTDYPGNDPVGDLAREYENGRDNGGLQIIVGANQFRELLDFRDKIVQWTSRLAN